MRAATLTSGKAVCLQGKTIRTQKQAARHCSVARSHKVTYAAADLPTIYKSLKPVADRVFVKVDKTEEKSTGGILLPTMAASKPTKGEVVAVGPGKSAEKGEKADAMGVKAGDMVSYSKFAGTEVAIGGVPHILLKEEDCIGTMSGDDVTTLNPLSDRVLIKCSEAEEETTGGLLLAGKSEKPLTGEVVAVGPGKGSDAMEVALGANVLYSKYSGTEFEGADGREYIVVRAADVLATLS